MLRAAECSPQHLSHPSQVLSDLTLAESADDTRRLGHERPDGGHSPQPWHSSASRSHKRAKRQLCSRVVAHLQPPPRLLAPPLRPPRRAGETRRTAWPQACAEKPHFSGSFCGLQTPLCATASGKGEMQNWNQPEGMRRGNGPCPPPLKPVFNGIFVLMSLKYEGLYLRLCCQLYENTFC